MRNVLFRRSIDLTQYRSLLFVCLFGWLFVVVAAVVVLLCCCCHCVVAVAVAVAFSVALLC